MQHQYWVTKKSVLRKLGGKEDECVVSSDAELDAKLELFKSINDSCVQLQRVIDLYQERLCYLAQEENTLGRYLKECGKNEKNANASHILITSGKALAYTGHQRLLVRSPLVRLHHEVETFKGRAVSDTRNTVLEMEKVRTEYRAALSWMKSASAQLDPDSSMSLERFRKAQSYVKSSKTKFDRFTLACLQKVDLLAAARCNMFSHALVPYQSALINFSTKANETLTLAANKVENVEPYDFSVVTELAISTNDKDRNTFFNAEYTDKENKENECGKKKEKPIALDKKNDSQIDTTSLLGEDFSASSGKTSEPTSSSSIDHTKPSSELLDLNWPSNSDFSCSDFMPSKLLQEGTFDFATSEKTEFNSKEFEAKSKKNEKIDLEKKGNQVSWLSLFAELDPLANPIDNNHSSDRA